MVLPTTPAARPAPLPRPGDGFTLIELLVVITIVAVLISLLLPHLQGARRSTEIAQCLSNNHQVMVARSMYALDYKGYNHFATLQSIGDGAEVYWTSPLLQLIAIGHLFLTTAIWRENEARGHGVMVTEGYVSNPSARFCTASGRTSHPATSESLLNVTSEHSEFGSRSFGADGRIAGPGVYHTRELYTSEHLGTYDPITHINFFQCGNRALSFCPFICGNDQTHHGQGAVSAYGDGSAMFLSFGGFLHTTLLFYDYAWLDTKGEDQFIYSEFQ